MDQTQIETIADKIKAGQVGVIPTDTIYGVVGRADTPSVVERIYQAKGRSYAKPFVILIADIQQLKELKIKVSREQNQALKKLWPGPNSAILPCRDNSMDYLNKRQKSLALRLPEPEWLCELLRLSGPLVATSANISGQPTASDINKIKRQLPGLDFYIEGKVNAEPSCLVRVHDDGSLEWLKR